MAHLVKPHELVRRNGLHTGVGFYDPDLAHPSVAQRFALAWSRLALADIRRRQWLDANARIPDADEYDAAPVCKVCGGEVEGKPNIKFVPAVCSSCIAEGWRAAPCKWCGGPLNKRDWSAKSEHLKRVCGHCRAEYRANRDGMKDEAA